MAPSPSPVNRPTHHDFKAALESLKVLNLYASFEDGPEMEELQKLSTKMQFIGISYEPKKKETTLHHFFLHQEKGNVIIIVQLFIF